MSSICIATLNQTQDRSRLIPRLKSRVFSASGIKVNFLWNWDQESEPVFETTLYELQAMDPDVVKRDIWDPLWEQKGGLASGENHEFWVEFEFVDNGEEQNMYQGDSLGLEWTFNATQSAGEDR